jgi:ABC-2 type transport system permease protein
MTGLTGTWRLTRLALRRDRVALPAWILGLSLFLAATTAMFVQSLATYDDAVLETELSTNNPGLRMLGLTSGPSVGGATMVRDFVTLAVLAAVMSTLAVVRHTRQNEELGRAEMVGATVVGRYAGLAAAVIVTVGANLVLAVLLGLAMVVNGQPAGGSFTAGAAVAGVGLVFVGVAATTSQLASTARGASGLAAAALGVSFLLSGIGNMLGTADGQALRVTSARPAWLSPIGWGQQMRPFGGNHWWLLVLFVALFLALLTVAVLLVGRRDVGRGLWPERLGDAQAGAALLSPTGLGWRLQRGALLGWAVGMLGFGLIFGAMSEQIQDVRGTALEWYTRMGGTDQVLDAYQASMIEMAGMAVAIYVVQILLRMRADEAGGTLESVLATGVSRSRWVLGHVLNAAAGAVVLLLTFAVSMGLTAGAVLGDTGTQVRGLTTAGLVQLPGIVVVGAAVIAAVGLVPRLAAALSWSLLLASLLLGPLFGPSLGLPQWAQELSPFTHVPKVPAADVTVAPLVALLAICLALASAGVAAIRRRDLVLPA